jgi:RHS repeat-associated protein
MIESNYDENRHRVDFSYDAMGRVTGVKEYYSTSNYYGTSYTYDGLGNLAKSVDAKGQTITYTHDDLNRITLTIYPDGFNETRTYDSVNNLVAKRDPNGNTVTYGYDAFNRMTNETYPDGSKATFSYDKNNNIISLSYKGNSATFTYDSRNRETSETWTIGGSQYTLGYGYDGVGNMVSTTYPDGTLVKYSIDPLNRIGNVTSGGTTLASFAYTNSSMISKITYGNGVQTTYTYDQRNRPMRVKVVQGASTLLDLNYTFDPVGNVAGINTESYTYDFLNRQTIATGPWGTVKYGYDGVGNRLWLYKSPTNTTYGYGAYDRLTSVGSTTYTYDNNGNLKTQTSGSTTTSYFYDFDNRLTKVTQNSSTLGNYTYSASGTRIQKIESGITTVFLNKGVSVLYEKQTSGGSTVTDYVYMGSRMLAKLSGSSIYYFHQDALGSSRLVTTGSTTSFSSNYQPFGPQYGASGSDPTYKYTDKPQDAATGLYYFGARYYNTTIGRFISRDPAGPQTKDPQSLNPYAYARNNPETLTDPTGAYWISQWNERGWNCVSWFWGWCTFAVPYWRFYIGVYASSFSLQANLNLFGRDAGLSASLGAILSPDMGALYTGLAAGASLVVGAFLALLFMGQIYGGFVASMLMTVGITGAIIAGLYASTDPHWRAGYFLGLLAMSIFFVAAVTGALAWVLGVIIRIFPNTTLNPISGIIYTFAWLASAIIGIIVWNPE